MNLLLLLSALLSALSGGQVGTRAPQVAVAVACVAVTSATASVRAVSVAGRPAVSLPQLADVAQGVMTYWRLAATAPLYLSRRRE